MEFKIGDIVQFKDIKYWNKHKKIKGEGINHEIIDIHEHKTKNKYFLRNLETGDEIMTIKEGMVHQGQASDFGQQKLFEWVG